jgi:hypothetical protein
MSPAHDGRVVSLPTCSLSDQDAARLEDNFCNPEWLQG